MNAYTLLYTHNHNTMMQYAHFRSFLLFLSPSVARLAPLFDRRDDSRAMHNVYDFVCALFDPIFVIIPHNERVCIYGLRKYKIPHST